MRKLRSSNAPGFVYTRGQVSAFVIILQGRMLTPVNLLTSLTVIILHFSFAAILEYTMTQRKSQ